jgi:hypothetical protein
MFERSNVRIANLILEGNLPYTMDGQLWTTGPADFKSVMTDFHISKGFTAVNDAQTVWIKRHNQSVLINAIFVDDVLHCTNDPALYQVFANVLKNALSSNQMIIMTPILAITLFMIVLEGQ